MLVLVLMTGAEAVGFAVGGDEAVLVGTTNPAFLKEASQEYRWVSVRRQIVGKLEVGSGAELTFNAGSRWSVNIPYAAITRLTYGREVAHRAPGLRLAFPWAGSSQFTGDAHYVLAVNYRDQNGTEQSEVFELGRSLVRPLFDALERRSASLVEVLSADACLKVRSPNDCGVGNSRELRGLNRIHVDARGSAEHRQNILAAIEAADLRLEVVEAVEDAEVSLTFLGQRFYESNKNIDAGRGEVTILRRPKPLVVLLFKDRDTSVWGRHPSINFGREFVRAYRQANGR
jgi:hypothetical protein